jgi:hypothetical protein
MPLKLTLWLPGGDPRPVLTTLLVFVATLLIVLLLMDGVRLVFCMASIFI